MTATAGGNEAIGTVSVLYGEVKAVSADGMVRALSVNTTIFAFDRVVTEDDGRVSIVLDGDPPAHLDIGSSSDILIDEDVFGEANPADIAAATADLDDLRVLLPDAGEDLGATDASAEAAGDGGAGDAALAAAGTLPDLFDDYRLVSDDAGKARLVFFDGDHHEIGSVTFDNIDCDPGLDVNLLLGQIDGDDGSEA